MTAVVLVVVAGVVVAVLMRRLAALKLQVRQLSSQNRQMIIRVECRQHETTEPFSIQRVTIRASCPKCGVLDLAACMVRFMICVRPPHEMCYTFVCWHCGDHVVKSVTLEVARLLLFSGVRPERVAADGMPVTVGRVTTMSDGEIWRALGVDPL